MTAYLGFENLISLATITALDLPGFEKENAYDWFTYTWWKAPNPAAPQINYVMEFAEPVDFTYFGLAAHDIDTNGGYIRLQVQIDGSYEIVAISYPENNAPIFQIFSNPYGPSTIWRFTVLAPDLLAPHIGVLSLGNVLALPEGIRAPFTPPPVAYDNKVINSVSQTGQFLGRSIERYGEKMTIRQDQVNPAWMRENWAAMADAIETQPFFYSWNYEQYPEDTVYAWLDSQLTPPQYTNSVHTAFSLNCKCLHRIRWF